MLLDLMETPTLRSSSRGSGTRSDNFRQQQDMNFIPIIPSIACTCRILPPRSQDQLTLRHLLLNNLPESIKLHLNAVQFSITDDTIRFHSKAPRTLITTEYISPSCNEVRTTQSVDFSNNPMPSRTKLGWRANASALFRLPLNETDTWYPYTLGPKGDTSCIQPVAPKQPDSHLRSYIYIRTYIPLVYSTRQLLDKSQPSS